MSGVDRLRGYIEDLRRPMSKETRASARERIKLRETAEQKLREVEHARARHDALDDPAVLRYKETVNRHAVGEQESHRRLQAGQLGWIDSADVPEPDEDRPVSPAEAALSRSEEEKRREVAWGAGYDEDGWAP